MTDLKFKPGDHVMVPAKVVVARDADGEQYRLQFSNGASVWVDGDDLASATLIERPLAVGDNVEFVFNQPGGGSSLVILSIDGGEAWVKNSVDGVRFSVPLSELRRAEERG